MLSLLNYISAWVQYLSIPDSGMLHSLTENIVLYYPITCLAVNTDKTKAHQRSLLNDISAWEWHIPIPYKTAVSIVFEKTYFHFNPSHPLVLWAVQATNQENRGTVSLTIQWFRDWVQHFYLCTTVVSIVFLITYIHFNPSHALW